MRRVPALCLLAAIVLAGCGAGPASPTPSPSGPGAASATPASPTATPSPSPTSTPSPTFAPSPTPGDRPDPASDRLGWENGYWHHESIAVQPADGFSPAEFEKLQARTMARVEVVRGLEFVEDVTVEFRRRSEFGLTAREDDWADAYWEGLFVVGEDRRHADAEQAMFDVVVDGLALRSRIILLVEDSDSPAVDAGVLAHELVHVLQRQHDAFSTGGHHHGIDDGRAVTAAVEGSANYYERRYLDRCGAEWSCVDGGADRVPAGASDINMGLYLDFAAPYTLGERFVGALVERNGTATLDRMRADPPVSTEQLIHPAAYPEETPVTVTVADRSTAAWERFTPRRGNATGGTVGEARLYVMLWYGGVVEREPVEVTTGQRVDLNYSHPATAGWAGDRFVPYTDGERYAYVYRSTWDTRADAREFAEAYRALLRAHGGERVEEDVWRIPDGPYADAFRVVRDGATVTVVNAPTVDGLAAVHPRE